MKLLQLFFLFVFIIVGLFHSYINLVYLLPSIPRFYKKYLYSFVLFLVKRSSDIQQYSNRKVNCCTIEMNVYLEFWFGDVTQQTYIPMYIHYTIFPLLCGHLCIFECLFIVIMDAHDDLCALTAPEQSWQHHTKICCFFLSSFPLFLFFTFSFSFILPCVSFFRHCSLLCLHCKQTPNNTRYVYCLSDGTVKSYLSKHSYMYL